MDATGARRYAVPVTSLPVPRLLAGMLTIPAVLALAACQPKVVVEAPKEPITINLNVNIKHEIRVKVDKDLDQLFEEEDGLF